MGWILIPILLFIFLLGLYAVHRYGKYLSRVTRRPVQKQQTKQANHDPGGVGFPKKDCDAQ